VPLQVQLHLQRHRSAAAVHMSLTQEGPGAVLNPVFSV
jgi:hypothetical protein